MNRKERRAIERAPRSGTSCREKQSHRLTPQVCTLYVPEARGYVAEFSATSFRVVDIAELAKLYIEDEATNAALTFRLVTGLRVAIRRYYCPHATISAGQS